MTDHKPIIGFPNHLDATFTGSGYNPVYLSGGRYVPTRARTNIIDPLFSNAARTLDASRASTFMNIDLGVMRDVLGAAIPKHNISRSGRGRYRASQLVNWQDFVVEGVNAQNATALNVIAPGNATVRAGDGFLIAGDDQLYQATVDVGLGENLVTYSEDFSNAAWTQPDAGYTVTTTHEAPDGSNNAVRFVWDGSSTGTIRQPIEAGTTEVMTMQDGTVMTTQDGTVMTTQPVGTHNGVAMNTSVFIKVNSYSGTGGISMSLCAGTPVAIDAATLVTGMWVRVDADVTAGTSIYFDITPGDGTTAMSIELWGGQVTTGDGLEDYAKTTAAKVTSAHGIITLERVDDAGTGLTAATIGTEELTCTAGRFLSTEELMVLDTGWYDVWAQIYAPYTLWYGHPSVADGKATPEEAPRRKIPFVYIGDGVTIARYWRFDVDDTDNAAGYLSFARGFMFPGYQPTRGVKYGVQFGRISNSTLVTSKGGADIPNEQPNARNFLVGIDNLPEDEAMSLLFDLLDDADTTKQIFFIFDKADTIHKHRRMFTARIKKLDPLMVPTFELMDAVIEVQEVIA